MITKRGINEYLYCEFGGEDEESRIAADWPFQLERVGSFVIDGGEAEVYLFFDDEEYYAVTEPVLTYYRKAGMELDDLRLQELGSSWIGRQDPVDLHKCILSDESVPSTKERRRQIADIARQHLGETSFTVLEGLLLRRSGKYLGLVQAEGSEKGLIVGTNITIRNIPFPLASAWRRLAVGIGKLVDEGRWE